MYHFYTAAGRIQTIGHIGDQKCPLVILGSKEYILDIQEMMLWTILNWRILDSQEAEALYTAKAKEVGYDTHRTFDQCLQRLVLRGLAAEGSGETAQMALYNLLSELYVVHISENIFLRAISFVKLTLINRVPFSVAKKLLGADKRSPDEKKVIQLARQSLLSTAEIIKCVECNALAFQSEEQLVDTLYHDDITTCDNLAATTQAMSACRPVLTAVANLYLRKQIIFERL